MTTTPPTNAQIDTWFGSWFQSSLPVYMAAGNFPWGETLTLVVVAWTTNAGTAIYQIMDPTTSSSDNPVVPPADPVLMNGLSAAYGVNVRVYGMPLPALPPVIEISAGDDIQAFYNEPSNWCTPT
jgi:hypothetical protein